MSSVILRCINHEAQQRQSRNVLMASSAELPRGGMALAWQDPNTCHHEAVGRLRHTHDHLSYESSRARAACGSNLQLGNTFLQRCAERTAFRIAEESDDAKTMQHMGRYMAAVHAPLRLYNATMNQPRLNKEHDSGTDVCLVILRALVLNVIAEFVPPLKQALQSMLSSATHLRDRVACAPSKKIEADMVACTFCGRMQPLPPAGVEAVNRCRVCQRELSSLVTGGGHREEYRGPSANLVMRSMYQRRLYFRSSISEFQGQQKRHIPKTVYDDVESYLALQGLVDYSSSSRRDRFRRVTCDATYEALKETDNPKWYRDIYLLHASLRDQLPTRALVVVIGGHDMPPSLSLFFFRS
jgi:hypothetical protein